MSNGEIAIKVEGVYKDFRLPHQEKDTIKSIFTTALKNITQHQTTETQHALRNISFEIKKGEFFGIVGRNGSGKSTLLKILAGIYQPTEGNVLVSGKLVPFIELGVGFNPELTGRENVFLNGALLGFNRSEIDKMYTDIVEFAELEKFMDQKLKNYSSGMQVRLAFSMAVRAQADILLIDEVLAVGDADFQRKCFEYFKSLKRNNKTVVFVSHDMDAVQKYCDRAMLIEKSRVIETGKALEVAEKYTRLFVEQANTKAMPDQSDKRWGDGLLRIEQVSTEITNSYVTIKQKVKAIADVEEVTAGIRIRFSSGQPITGTNSQLEHKVIGDMKKSEIVELEWQIPNIFSDGQYYADLASAHDNGTNMSDWWDEANKFTIKKARVLPYPIDPEFKLLIRHISKLEKL